MKLLKMVVFHHVVPCSLVQGDRRFWDAYWHPHQSDEKAVSISKTSVRLNCATSRKTTFILIAVRTWHLSYKDTHYTLLSPSGPSILLNILFSHRVQLLQLRKECSMCQISIKTAFSNISFVIIVFCILCLPAVGYPALVTYGNKLTELYYYPTIIV
jgi:hypothetical protein